MGERREAIQLDRIAFQRRFDYIEHLPTSTTSCQPRMVMLLDAVLIKLEPFSIPYRLLILLPQQHEEKVPAI